MDRTIDAIARELTAIDAPVEMRARVLERLTASGQLPAGSRKPGPESRKPRWSAAFGAGWSLRWAMAGAAAAVLVASLAWWVAMKPTAGPEQRRAGDVGKSARPPVTNVTPDGGTQSVPVVAANDSQATRRAGIRGTGSRTTAPLGVAAAEGRAEIDGGAIAAIESPAAITIDALVQTAIEIEQIDIAPISISALPDIAPIEIAEVHGPRE